MFELHCVEWYRVRLFLHLLLNVHSASARRKSDLKRRGLRAWFVTSQLVWILVLVQYSASNAQTFLLHLSIKDTKFFTLLNIDLLTCGRFKGTLSDTGSNVQTVSDLIIEYKYRRRAAANKQDGFVLQIQFWPVISLLGFYRSTQQRCSAAGYRCTVAVYDVCGETSSQPAAGESFYKWWNDKNRKSYFLTKALFFLKT